MGGIPPTKLLLARRQQDALYEINLEVKWVEY